MSRLLPKAPLYGGILAAAIVFGLVLYEHFSWSHVRAQVAVFFDTLAHGNLYEVIAALTSLPVMIVAGVLAIGAVLIWDMYFRRRR
jgi:hypothetical protein